MAIKNKWETALKQNNLVTWFGFVLGALISLFLLEIISRNTVDDQCLLRTKSEFARLRHLKFRFDHRTEDVPAVVFLGASDAREILDHEKAEIYFSARGYNFFNLAIHSSNSTLEQYQILSSLKLDKYDLVFFNIAIEDLSNDKPPSITSELENPDYYLTRMRLWNKSIAWKQLFILVLNDYFTWHELRESWQKCFFSINLDYVSQPIYRYGNRPERSKIFLEKLAKYQDKKKDYGQTITENSPNVLLLNFVKERFGRRIVFSEIPRNPKVDLIYSESYLDAHQQFSQVYDPIKFGQYIEIPVKRFYDFSHVHARGRKGFTREFLPIIFKIVEERNKE